MSKFINIKIENYIHIIININNNITLIINFIIQKKKRIIPLSIELTSDGQWCIINLS